MSNEFLTNLYSSSTTPVWSALLLGLLTAISPCPLATNITAMAYISKDIKNKNRVFINGLSYTLGRAFSYIVLAMVLWFGADQLMISGFFQKYGERILGPLLILIGCLMLGIFRLNFSISNRITEKFQESKEKSFKKSFLLGIIFALAFCPYSGVLYFGMFIPLTIQNSSFLFLPLIYAIATGIPVVIFAWLLAYTISGVGKFYNQLKNFDVWFRRIVAIAFISIGINYVRIIWF
jgi:cytochrome c-type biogenesis protein